MGQDTTASKYHNLNKIDGPGTESNVRAFQCQKFQAQTSQFQTFSLFQGKLSFRYSAYLAICCLFVSSKK